MFIQYKENFINLNLVKMITKRDDFFMEERIYYISLIFRDTAEPISIEMQYKTEEERDYKFRKLLEYIEFHSPETKYHITIPNFNDGE